MKAQRLSRKPEPAQAEEPRQEVDMPSVWEMVAEDHRRRSSKQQRRAEEAMRQESRVTKPPAKVRAKVASSRREDGVVGVRDVSVFFLSWCELAHTVVVCLGFVVGVLRCRFFLCSCVCKLSALWLAKKWRLLYTPLETF